MIIDSHAHVFPEIIAEKAAKNIGKFYGIEMRYNGTRDKLLEEGGAAGVDKFLIHSVATTPKQVESINRFISDSVKLYPDKFIGFATLHPDCENLEEEFKWAMDNGLRGIKLHPDFQNFDLGSDKAKEIYKLAEGKCPVLIHMGDKRTQFSKAEHLVPVLDEFPELDVIAAHFGGYSEWGTGAAFLATTRAYVDTSSSMFALRDEQIRELIEIYTPERIMFGTDYPMWDANEELGRFMSLGLSEEIREQILHKTLETLLAKYDNKI